MVRGALIYLSFPPNRKIIDSIKKIQFYGYNNKTKQWTVPYSQEAIDMLIGWSFEIHGDENPILKRVTNKEWLKEKVDHIEGIRPYQIEGVQFFKWNRGKALLADSAGIGKTIQAILFCKQSKDNVPAVIVVPASIKKQWKKEWEKWIGTPVKILNGQTPEKIPENTTVIINWDILKYWVATILDNNFRTVIADECQFAMSSMSKRSIALQRLVREINNFIPMSGTPIKSKPGQFFTILNLLKPDRFPDERQFKNKYCIIRKSMGKEIEIRGGRNLGILYNEISDIMIRREKKDVLKDLPELPPPIRVPLEISEEDLEEYQRLEEEILNSIEGGNIREKIESLQWSAFAYKKHGCVKWIKDFLNSDEKIIIGCWHHSVMDYLKEHFPEAVMLHGKITGKNKEENIEKFISDKSKQILIVQITTMSGIDGLQNVCNNCAVLELPWQGADIEQFRDRLYRSGQQKTVNMYYILAENTIDEVMAELLDKSTDLFNKIVRGKETKPEELILNLLKNRL